MTPNDMRFIAAVFGWCVGAFSYGSLLAFLSLGRPEHALTALAWLAVCVAIVWHVSREQRRVDGGDDAPP